MLIYFSMAEFPADGMAGYTQDFATKNNTKRRNTTEICTISHTLWYKGLCCHFICWLKGSNIKEMPMFEAAVIHSPLQQ
jgi:hypothetical protein